MLFSSFLHFFFISIGEGEGKERKDIFSFPIPTSLSLDKNKMAAIIVKIRTLEFACTARYKLTVIITLKSLDDQLQLSGDRF